MRGNLVINDTVVLAIDMCVVDDLSLYEYT